jgi:hypothetical protein
MSREPYVYRLILDYLEKQKEPKGTAEIVQAVGIPYPSIARVTRKLTREKRIKRIPGEGHSYLYLFKTHDLPVDKKALHIPPENPNIKPVKSSELKAICLHWASNGWKPKTPEASRALVINLSRLYQFMWLDVTRATPVDQSDLDLCKSQLIEAKSIADNFAEFFARLLATAELWDSKKLSSYVLEDEENPQDFLERARRVSEALTQSND